MNNKPVAWTNQNTFCKYCHRIPSQCGCTHPVKEQYKFGVDWSKDGNAVTILKICEDGVAEVVFMDYQETTHPVKELNDGGEPVKNATYWKRQYNLMATQNDNLKSGLYHANEQIKYLESHLVEKQDESFDRTASHMAGEYVSYKPELTDELNNLKKENKFFKEILSEMDKQVYNIEFLKQPMQILEDGQIVPVFKELTDEEIIEPLAELEHEQWMKWADTIMQTEKISDARFARWASCMIPYADLTEEMKEFDREWARKALAILRKAQGK